MHQYIFNEPFELTKLKKKTDFHANTRRKGTEKEKEKENCFKQPIKIDGKNRFYQILLSNLS